MPRRPAAALLAAVLVLLPIAPAVFAAPAPQATLGLPSIGLAAPFLERSQNIAATDYNALSEVYFLLKTVRELDPSLSTLNATMNATLTQRLQALQNADGGFGDWEGDRSRTGSTARAAEALSILGAAPLNRTGALAFLDSLQITGTAYSNGGFRSSRVDRDSDVSSTANAVRAYAALGAPVLNATVVASYVRAHQNLDGGFGLQTNRLWGTSWPSLATATFDGLAALQILGAAADFPAAAVTFLRGLQNADGGFGLNAGNLTSRTAYTMDVLEDLKALGSSASNPSAASTFLLGNQLGNGGFVENPLDPLEGIHTTYFAARALHILGTPFNEPQALAFALAVVPSENDGGFGDHPGMTSNVRFTFDAVFALNALGRRPLDPAGAAAYLLSLENADGGFGAAGLSSAESTSRALAALQVLGEPIPRPENASRFLRSLQNGDGGFASAPGGASTVTYTYRAVVGLDVLGDRPNSTAGALAFLQARQQADGGFADGAGSTGSTMVVTWQATVALGLLGALPLNLSQAVAYIGQAQNPDGGFRHAPADATAPANFSAALYSYAAALALDAAASLPADRTAMEDYLARLQSTDGAFADHANFTSAVADTFSTIVALLTLEPDLYNGAPALSGLTAAPAVTNSTSAVAFRVTYADSDGQMPARIVLTVNGERHVMVPEVVADLDVTDGKTFTFARTLPIGNFTYQVTASDGFKSASLRSDPSVVEVRFDPGPVPPPGSQTNGTLPGNQTNGTLPGNQTNGTLPGNQSNGTLPGNQSNGTLPGNQSNGTSPGGNPPPVQVFHAPEIAAAVDPPAGSPTTQFRFTATYRQAEGVAPRHVRLQIDASDWFEMYPLGSGSARDGLAFDFLWNLAEGNHTFRVEAFDGRNAVQTPLLDGPYVAPPGPIRPDAATFAAVKATVEARYGVAITPQDVERGIFEGAFAWKVRVGGATHFVALDGSKVLDDPAPPPASGPATTPFPSVPLLALGALGAFGGAGVLVARRKRR